MEKVSVRKNENKSIIHKPKPMMKFIHTEEIFFQMSAYKYPKQGRGWVSHSQASNLGKKQIIIKNCLPHTNKQNLKFPRFYIKNRVMKFTEFQTIQRSSYTNIGKDRFEIKNNHCTIWERDDSNILAKSWEFFMCKSNYKSCKLKIAKGNDQFYKKLCRSCVSSKQ